MRNLILLLALVAAEPALAHPHVWVAAKAEIVFEPDGKVTALRHRWTFDELTSAGWLDSAAGEGGKASPEKLAAIAGEMKSYLAENSYFTALRANGTKPAFAEWRGERLTVEGRQVTLHFELPLRAPAPANRQLVLSVSDPSFFIDFQTAPGDDAVKLDGAPTGCVLAVSRPKPQPPADKPIGETFFQSLANAASFAAQFSSRSTVACP